MFQKSTDNHDLNVKMYFYLQEVLLILFINQRWLTFLNFNVVTDEVPVVKRKMSESMITSTTCFDWLKKGITTCKIVLCHVMK